MRQVLPHMLDQKWGRIINIASVHGLVASKNKVGCNYWWCWSSWWWLCWFGNCGTAYTVCVRIGKTRHGGADESRGAGERRQGCDGQLRVSGLGAHRAHRTSDRTACARAERVHRRGSALAPHREAAVVDVCHTHSTSRHGRVSCHRRRLSNHR